MQGVGARRGREFGIIRVAMLAVYIPFILDMLMYDSPDAVLGPVRRLLGS